MSTTHLLIRNFLLLNSTSMAFNISIDLIIKGYIASFSLYLLVWISSKKDFIERLIIVARLIPVKIIKARTFIKFLSLSI
jgi:hypothetical protein